MIFHKSTVNLQFWFYAIYLMSSTRCGISAAQLGREIGVTYKTADRMFKQIRTLLGAGRGPVVGQGRSGRNSVWREASRVRHHWDDPLAGAVVGEGPQDDGARMVERGGRVRVKVQAERSLKLLHSVRQYVSLVIDGFHGRLGGLPQVEPDAQDASACPPPAANIYVDGDLQKITIQGFFGLLKNGIRGVYHAVSTDYLQSDRDEYAWRYNHRHDSQPMFWMILDGVQKDRPAPQ